MNLREVEDQTYELKKLQKLHDQNTGTQAGTSLVGNLIMVSSLFFTNSSGKSLSEIFTTVSSYNFTVADAVIGVGISVVSLAAYLRDVKNEKRDNLLNAYLKIAEDNSNDLSPYEKGREEQKISTIKNVYNDRVNDAKNLLSMGLKQIGVSVAASLGALVALSGATVVAPAVVAVGGFAAGAAGIGMINIYRTRSAGALADKEVENAKMLAVSRETSRRLKI